MVGSTQAHLLEVRQNMSSHTPAVDDSKDIFNFIKTITDHNAINQVKEIARTISPPSNEAILRCNSIQKYSELTELSETPYKLYVVRNFTPKTHLVCRIDGDYSRSLNEVRLRDSSLFIRMGDEYVSVLDATDSNISYEKNTHMGVATIGGCVFNVHTKGAELGNVGVRSISDNVIEITAAESQWSHNTGIFSFRALLIHSDTLLDSTIETFPWESKIQINMVNHLKRFSTKIMNNCYCPIPLKLPQKTWNLIGTINGLVNQYGAVHPILYEKMGDCITRINNNVTKVILACGANSAGIFSYHLRGIPRENNEFKDCQQERISTKEVQLTYHTPGFSFVTEIVSDLPLRRDCEVIGPFFKGRVATVVLRNIAIKFDQIILTNILSK